jgi:hypothetical protein
MKKLIALLLGILILASIPCVAFAEVNKQDVKPIETPVEEETNETPEYHWEDLEPYLKALGMEGIFYSLDYFGLDLWVPNALEFQELTDEELEKGQIAYATDADDNWRFIIVNLVYDQQIESLYEWQNLLKEQEGIADSVICYVNDLAVLEYLLPEKDCFVCDLLVSDGSILEFIWWPFSDEAFAVNAGFMSNSLMLTSE